MTKDEALKLALEALKQIDEAMPFPVAKLAQAAIKEALAKPNFCPRCGKRLGTHDWDIHTCTPPQRAWIALTDEERKETLQSVNTGFVVDASVIAIAIEAKLKEKNT